MSNAYIEKLRNTHLKLSEITMMLDKLGAISTELSKGKEVMEASKATLSELIDKSKLVDERLAGVEKEIFGL